MIPGAGKGSTGGDVPRFGTGGQKQRTPLQRAGASVSRAVTDEGLMAQEW